MSNHQDPKLSKLLRSWDIPTEAPTGFEREVWNRISARAEVPALTFSGVLDSFVARFIRPQVVAAVVLFVVFSGAALGVVNAGIKTRQTEARVAQSYLNSIDPVTHQPHTIYQ